jgi:hypothetical protein
VRLLPPLFVFPLAKSKTFAFRGRTLVCFGFRISNKEFRTAEVFESSKAIFFTSIFCGFLFSGSAVRNERLSFVIEIDLLYQLVD